MENFNQTFSWGSHKWTFDTQGITIESNPSAEELKKMDNGTILHCFIPYGNIKKIEYIRQYIKHIELTFFGKDLKQYTWTIWLKDYKPNDIKSAVKFAQKQLKLNRIDTEKFIIYKEVTENKFDSDVYIKQCQICGEVFRYTSADIRRNEEIQKEADKMKTPLLDAFLYNPIKTSMDEMKAESKLATKKDFYSCPRCKSNKLKRITEQELKEIQEKKNAPAPTAVSSADELKKYKELLDSGIITQEEFDQKKKQLLGL